MCVCVCVCGDSDGCVVFIQLVVMCLFIVGSAGGGGRVVGDEETRLRVRW